MHEWVMEREATQHPQKCVKHAWQKSKKTVSSAADPLHAPNVDTHQKTSKKIGFQHQPGATALHCSTHHSFRKKPRVLTHGSVSVHSDPDGEVNDSISSLSQQQPHPSHLSLETTPSPAVFAHNSHLLQAPNLPGAILDREGR